jgi:hypothetical protein
MTGEDCQCEALMTEWMGPTAGCVVGDETRLRDLYRATGSHTRWIGVDVILRSKGGGRGVVGLSLLQALAISVSINVRAAMSDENILSGEAVPVPSRIAERLPNVVFRGASTIPHHEIQRARTTEHLSARPVVCVAARVRLGDSVHGPVQRRADECTEEPRDIDQIIALDAWASLDDEDRDRGVF